jgi:hypothetical protein
MAPLPSHLIQNTSLIGHMWLCATLVLTQNFTLTHCYVSMPPGSVLSLLNARENENVEEAEEAEDIEHHCTEQTDRSLLGP